MRGLAPCVLLAGLGVALAGCAGGGGGRTTQAATTTHVPPRPRLVVAEGRKAVAGVDLRHGVRLLSPTRLAIVTTGSSGCPATPTSLVVESPHTIRIRLVVEIPPGADVCPADVTPTAFVVAIDPRRVDVHQSLTIRLDYPRAKKPVVRVAPPL